VDFIGEEDTRNAAEVKDSLSTADHMKNGVDEGPGKFLASIELLDDVAILW
jgi:hypothetical protein